MIFSCKKCMIGIILLTLPCLIKAQINPSKKHALLVAVADYPETGGWDQLSALNDVQHLQKGLKNQGFDSKNIEQLVNMQVTKTGIQAAFERLLKRIQAGDIVVVHFSGHGLQLETNANKIDGLDECFVTYPALSPEKIDINDSVKLHTEMAKYLRGHELGELLKGLRKKLGPWGDLLVMLDFCNSGGATRGENKVRGGKKPLVSKSFKANQHQRSDSSQLFREAQLGAELSGLSPYCVISATRPEELDTETKDENGKGIGPLSYAAYLSFQKLSSTITYQGLFAKIQSTMHQLVKEQHPLLEGNASNKRVFGGAVIQQEPFYEIDQIVSPALLTIKAGNLSGLGVGTKLGFYPIGTTQTKALKPIVIGTITKSNRYDAEISLETAGSIKNSKDAWVFVLEKQMALPKIMVALSPYKHASPEDKSSLEQLLINLPNVGMSDQADLWLVKGEEKDSILIASNASCFAAATGLLQSADALKEQLRRYGQYQFLSGLEEQVPEMNVLVKLLPVINDQIDTAAMVQKTVNGILEFTEGDQVTLSIHNMGKKAVYVNILDLQPDGIINAILPYKNAPEGKRNYLPQDLRIMPGQEYVFEPKDFLIKLSKPYGTEVFKVFVSEKEIDLEPMATKKFQLGNTIQKRGDLTQLELLLLDSYQTVIKRGNSASDGSIMNLLFRIKPRSN
ncbi:MAG TPA: caspase family protein [Sediminibacterium sp.]|nr:caspase family protein [Sediminibacterium sp.]HQS55293.1 caspase family protein [Sediminibacterium sp.]